MCTSFYCPPFLTSEPLNHNNIFVGLASGDIYIYQIKEIEQAEMVIKFKTLFPFVKLKKDMITDMKCNPLMMHRIAIAYEETAVVIYSTNKNRAL